MSQVLKDHLLYQCHVQKDDSIYDIKSLYLYQELGKWFVLRHHGVPQFLNSSECMAAFITFRFIIDFFTINIEHGCNIHVIPGWKILQYWIRLTPENVLLQLWWIFCFINNIHRNFEMSINESIQFKIIIIFSEWIIQSLGNSEPAKEEEKLDGHEDGIVELDLITDPLPIDLSPD